MAKFAQVAVYVPGVNDQFDYLIPQNWQGRLKPGHLVEVPFNTQQVQGIVTSFSETSDFPDIKEIAAVIDDVPVVSPPYIKLAKALAVTFFQPIPSYLMTMLPPGLGQRSDTLYKADLPEELDVSTLTSLQRRLLETLSQRGDLRGRQFDHIFRHIDWRKSIHVLIKNGLITAQPILPAPKVKKKQINTVRLAPNLDIKSIEDISFGREGSAASERRRRMIDLLIKEREDTEVSYIYASTGASSADIRYLEKQSLVVVNSREVIRDPVEGVSPEGTLRPNLTEDQRSAWQIIKKEIVSSSPLPTLIRGITGSGKTELYLRAVEQTEKMGKQAVVLVPEISLTPQTIQRFLDRFPGRVGVIHSRLSPGERYDTWRRARQGEFSVLIGPRSALFTPMPNIGVIILDECHDDSYYQAEMGPVYDSIEAALTFGKIIDAAVIFGSATPNVDLYFHAQYQHWRVIHLEKRIAARIKGTDTISSISYLPLPSIDVVDMREELQQGNRSMFSRSLQEALKIVIEKRQQAILYLNRRGSATIIFCRDCGYTARCPKCDFPLTFHQDTHQLMCHTCGYSRKILKKCPNCGSLRIRQYGMGTERVEQALIELIPSVRILRWDADTASGKQSEAIILSHFKRHNADVLIGTQMLAKGLDLPLVTLVGVIMADVGLNFPDYRAGERAFQLLTQVAGRAGRSALGGCVFLQTFQPEHYAIQYAAEHDFLGFYDADLDYRRELQYPPFSKVIRFETRDLDPQIAKERAVDLASRLSEKIAESADKTLQMVGPVPPYFGKRSGYYRWQIILKGNQPELVVPLVNLQDWRVDVNPPNLL
ncbi:MAG: primosomal protein N' [Pelolinea sp.]|nr:primosomal protein N' [Pelolinea sp.]